MLNKNLLLTLCFFAFSANAEILWKPESISYQLKQTPEILKTGLVLEVKQTLKPGETGWKQSKIDVPDNWDNAKLEMRQGTIFILVGEKEYYFNAKNKGPLSFEIRDGGIKTDAQLQAIWAKHATST